MSLNASKTKVAFSLGAGSVTALGQRPRRRTGKRRTWIAPLVLLAPTAIVLLLVVGYPLLQLIINSFQDFGLRALFTGQTAWIGFANYTGIFADPLFWPVLLRTFGFTASLVIGSVSIGMFFSELLVRLGTTMRSIFSFVMIIAWALPTVASTLIWQWQFQPLYGVLNWVITQIGWFGNFTSHSWTSTPGEAFFIVWLLIVWQAVPFVAFSLYAGQSQIPEECYEAAMLDGAGVWQIYRSVTLPFLAPVLYLVTILSIIWDFNVFNQLWILTQGGPSGGTTTLGIWSFQKAFASNSFGQGSAIAIVTTIILMAVTSFYIRRLIRSGEGL